MRANWLLVITALAISITSVVIPKSANAQQFRQFCVVTWGNKQTSVTYLPNKSSLHDCSIIAQALEQQPPTVGPTQYELGCQSGGLFMVTSPRSWQNQGIVGNDWKTVAPGIAQASIDACADTWSVPR
jgi:hypothetical protein